MKPTLITVVGPTAIGKTSFAISLAKHFNCEIVSCDSRQFYKEMSIGTAVPKAQELNEVPHHFIQHISIHEQYNVGQFENDALLLLQSLFQKNSIQVMVGGSGLYVDAVNKGFDDFPEIEDHNREFIRTAYQKNGIEFLQNFLLKNDPDYFQYLENNNPQTLKNPQRLMRFCEVCTSTGKPYSSFIKREKTERDFNILTVGLDAPREVMFDRINKRVQLMIKEGLVEEAEKLLPYSKLNALQTVGYRELFEYFNHNYSLEIAVEEIQKNTRRFAKRQLTWFKRNTKTHWFPYNIPHIEAIQQIEKILLNANISNI